MFIEHPGYMKAPVKTIKNIFSKTFVLRNEPLLSMSLLFRCDLLSKAAIPRSSPRRLIRNVIETARIRPVSSVTQRAGHSIKADGLAGSVRLKGDGYRGRRPNRFLEALGESTLSALRLRPMKIAKTRPLQEGRLDEGNVEGEGEHLVSGVYCIFRVLVGILAV